MIDYYELLGVGRNASSEEIKRAYRRRMMDGGHPDLGGDTERARQLNEAHRVLVDPRRRAQYDRELRAHEAAIRRRQLERQVRRAGRTGLESLRELWNRVRAPRRRPPHRLVRCAHCRRANRIPEDRSLVEARCGACRQPVLGPRAMVIRAVELLRAGLARRQAGQVPGALGLFHEAIEICPGIQNPYLEIAAVYRAWRIPHQARIYQDLAERREALWLSPTDLGT